MKTGEYLITEDRAVREGRAAGVTIEEIAKSINRSVFSVNAYIARNKIELGTIVDRKKMNADQRAEAKRLYADGMTKVAIAERYGVGITALARILPRRVAKDVHGTRSLAFRLSPEKYTDLDRLAKRFGMTKVHIIRGAVEREISDLTRTMRKPNYAASK